MHADNANFAHTRISAVVKRYAKYDMGDSSSRTVQNDSTSNAISTHVLSSIFYVLLK